MVCSSPSVGGFGIALGWGRYEQGEATVRMSDEFDPVMACCFGCPQFRSDPHKFIPQDRPVEGRYLHMKGKDQSGR